MRVVCKAVRLPPTGLRLQEAKLSNEAQRYFLMYENTVQFEYHKRHKQHGFALLRCAKSKYESV